MFDLPEDLRAEILLEYLQNEHPHVLMCGPHKRNACMDVLGVEADLGRTCTVRLARGGLYNSLPEYFFHKLDRFSNLGGHLQREQFDHELNTQQQEKNTAETFFAPLDIALFMLEENVHRNTLLWTTTNKVLQDLLYDRPVADQLQNRFIKRTLPYLTCAKDIRGNRTLITFMLRAVFGAEGLSLTPTEQSRMVQDDKPRYEASEGGPLGEVYAGNSFEASVLCYVVRYWSDDECNETFLAFTQEVDQLRLFVCDWFLSVEEDLMFIIEDMTSGTWLDDNLNQNYLNYNTNL